MINPIREKREKLKMTQRELAAKLNIDRSAVALWELGVNKPKADNLIALSKIFKCKIDNLVCKDV